MIRAAILALLLVPSQQSFTYFSYCRQTASGSFESLCVQLGPDGVGETRFKHREGDDIKFGMTLSSAGKDQFLSVLAGTKYLANSKNYESKRKVADLGVKHLVLETASGRREAEFNYSDMKDVTALVTFFEGLIQEEAMVVDLEWAKQFDPLGIPDRLDQIEKVMKTSRFPDTKSMSDVLDVIEKDDRIVNYARTHARELKEKLSADK